jgi:hypothetical protein
MLVFARAALVVTKESNAKNKCSGAVAQGGRLEK